MQTTVCTINKSKRAKMPPSRNSSSRIAPCDNIEQITTQRNVDSDSSSIQIQDEVNPIENWLPITEVRNGSLLTCIFHLVCSGLGIQTLLLPVAIATLGWGWGVASLSIGFLWQLYTKWLLIQLHESSSGVRYNRFIQLAIEAFGPKYAKLFCIFPVIYLSSAQCTSFIITGANMAQLLYQIMCEGESYCPKPLHPILWHLVLVCIAVVFAQYSNLHSLSFVSLFGMTALLLYCTLLWFMTSLKGVNENVSYSPMFDESTASMTKAFRSLFALEAIALCFKGHNLTLEIQATLPSSSSHPPRKTMWKATKISFLMITLCLFPIAIGGYAAYGNKIGKDGLFYTYWNTHKDSSSKTVMGLTVMFILVHQLCSYPLFSLIALDNVEFRYAMATKKPCSYWLRRGLRMGYGAIVFFLSIAFPFLPYFSALIGGLCLPLTFAYPCFMWICIKKPGYREPMYFLNLGLGCLGTILGVLSFIAAVWNLCKHGMHANFFNP